jgi:hypothetical protein
VTILQKLKSAGVTVRCDEQHRIFAKPASRMTDELRLLIRRNRTAILGELEAAHRLAVKLVSAINACCDKRGDDASNRAGLIAESSQETPEHQSDLREHFEAEARRYSPSRGRAS